MAGVEEVNPATPENLAALRKAVSGSETGLPHHDDNSLSRFLWAKKTVERAAGLVTAHDEFIAKHNLQNQTLADVEQAFQTNFYSFHPGMRTDKGEMILWARPRFLNWKEIEPQQVQLFMFFCINTMTKAFPETKAKGLCLVIDWRGAGWKNFNRKLPPLMLKMVQECLPARMKVIAHLEQPTWFSMVWAIVSPLLSSKLRSRVTLLGPAPKLLTLASPPNLASELGGSLDVTLEMQRSILSRRY